MKIMVMLFAGAREKLGTGRLEQELPEGATLQALIDTLYRTYPELESVHAKFAVNAAYAQAETVLRHGDQVACIPPVGGG
jgi:molybdopterin converting factor subunit 1